MYTTPGTGGEIPNVPTGWEQPAGAVQEFDVRLYELGIRFTVGACRCVAHYIDLIAVILASCRAGVVLLSKMHLIERRAQTKVKIQSKISIRRINKISYDQITEQHKRPAPVQDRQVHASTTADSFTPPRNSVPVSGTVGERGQSVSTIALTILPMSIRRRK